MSRDGRNGELRSRTSRWDSRERSKRPREPSPVPSSSSYPSIRISTSIFNNDSNGASEPGTSFREDKQNPEKFQRNEMPTADMKNLVNIFGCRDPSGSVPVVATQRTVGEMGALMPKLPRIAHYKTHNEEEEVQYVRERRPLHYQPIPDHLSESDSEDDNPSATHPRRPILHLKDAIFNNYDFKKRSLNMTHLSAYEHKERIIKGIERNRVLIIDGYTGCGKTTQVPQFIIDRAKELRRPCKVIVTQPRKLAAMSVARRVCEERCWKLGTVVGYQVGLEKNVSDDTLVTYMTTGVLLEKLIHGKSLKTWTHIIVDEVHERDINTDLLLLVIKKILMEDRKGEERHVKLILMSATVNSVQFSKYFEILGRDYEIKETPVIKIPTTNKFKILVRFLDDLVSSKELDEIQKEIHKDRPALIPQMYTQAVRTIQGLDQQEANDPRLRKPNGHFMLQKERGSVLVFLPGLMEIKRLRELLEEENRKKAKSLGKECKDENPYQWDILPLHSSLNMTDGKQRKVFQRPEPYRRKIILSTNIAESSITVPDIVYVIDFCLTKSNCVDEGTNFSCLRICWASLSQCIQRAGRAGRVRDGIVYRLLPSKTFRRLDQDAEPDMVKSGLENAVLQLKMLDMGSPQDIFCLALNPPELSKIERAISNLKEVGALTAMKRVNNHSVYSTCDGDVTFMGEIMSVLPISPQCARLIMLANCFGVMNEAVIIAAGLSGKSPFSAPFHQQLDPYLQKLNWAKKSYSDCLAILNAYRAWYSKFGESHNTDKSGASVNTDKNGASVNTDKTGASVNTDKNGASVNTNKNGASVNTNKNGASVNTDKFGASVNTDKDKGMERNVKSSKDKDAEKKWARSNNIQLAKMRDIKSMVEDIKKRLKRVELAEYKFPIQYSIEEPLPKEIALMLKISIAGAFYPNYLRRGYPDLNTYEKELSKEVCENDLFRTVYFKGFPAQHNGKLYAKHVADYLSHGLSVPSVKFYGQKVFAIFDSTEKKIGPVSEGVYRAVKKRLIQDKLEFKILPVEDEEDELRAHEEAIKRRRFIKCPRQIDLPRVNQHFVEAVVTYVETPGQFWIVTTVSARKQQEMNDKINAGNVERIRIKRRNAFVGALVLAPFKDVDDDSVLYYRGRIQAPMNGLEQCLIYFIDWGNSELVSVHELRKLPPSLIQLKYNEIPGLAIECRMCLLKPAVVHGSIWTDAAIDSFKRMTMTVTEKKEPKMLEIEIHNIDKSVISGIFTLKAVDGEPEFNINRWLLQRGFADSASEPHTAQLNFTSRERSYLINCEEEMKALNLEQIAEPADRDFVEPPETGNNAVILIGPFSPLELDYYSMCQSSGSKKVILDNQSVNCVILDHEPTAPTARLVVASSITMRDDGAAVVARETTMMPATPGMPALMSLIFAPRAELRCETHKSRYTGALCGLGTDPEGKPIYMDHDMEVIFDREIDNDDIDQINLIRGYLNVLMRKNQGQNNEPVHSSLFAAVVKSIKKDRKVVKEIWPPTSYAWNKIRSSHMIRADRTSIQPLDSLLPHDKIRLTKENPTNGFIDFAV